MARQGIGDFPKADLTEEVTRGYSSIAVVFRARRFVLYALSLPGRLNLAIRC
jgi:hypothetical protein